VVSPPAPRPPLAMSETKRKRAEDKALLATEKRAKKLKHQEAVTAVTAAQARAEVVKAAQRALKKKATKKAKKEARRAGAALADELWADAPAKDEEAAEEPPAKDAEEPPAKDAAMEEAEDATEEAEEEAEEASEEAEEATEEAEEAAEEASAKEAAEEASAKEAAEEASAKEAAEDLSADDSLESQIVACRARLARLLKLKEKRDWIAEESSEDSPYIPATAEEKAFLKSEAKLEARLADEKAKHAETVALEHAHRVRLQAMWAAEAEDANRAARLRESELREIRECELCSRSSRHHKSRRQRRAERNERADRAQQGLPPLVAEPSDSASEAGSFRWPAD
jgi:hypothetical protein